MIACGNDLVSHGNELLTCGNEVLTRGYGFLSRGNKIKIMPRSSSMSLPRICSDSIFKFLINNFYVDFNYFES